MKATQNIRAKIFNINGLVHQIRRWRLQGKTIVFTNGVFDVLHPGHIASLEEAASYGEVLIVAINTDASVKRLKGENRPVNDEQTRALMLASMLVTDAVILFDEDTPQQLIATLLPDVLVKGGDYSIDQIAGAKEVLANGGKVIRAQIINGLSTTRIIERIKNNP